MTTEPISELSPVVDLTPKRVFQAFHHTCRKLRIMQPRIQIIETEEAGRVLHITYRVALRVDSRWKELGTVMDAAATTLVVLAQGGEAVPGGISIISHDGNGHQVHQAGITTADAAAFVAGQLTKEAFVDAWVIR